jgi:hypothetical protein
LSVQYASQTGTTWQVTNLPAVMVPAGGYLLVQEASGGAVGTMLPTPDATGTGTGINMSATNGKVALVNGTTALAGACPTTNVIDLVGYGAANCFEGTATAPTGSNTTSDRRGMSGCTDTDMNDADFTAGTPDPRNSASAANICP